MRPNCPYELFSYQPFWDVEIKHTALIGPSAHPTAMLQFASSDTGLWNTVPGLGNMTSIVPRYSAPDSISAAEQTRLHPSWAEMENIIP